MFCEERIEKVYIGISEHDDMRNHEAFLDCYHDIAYHCTDGCRIVLATENHAISLSAQGVIHEPRGNFKEKTGEWLREGIEPTDANEPPWVHFETTLFVGERILSVTKQDSIYLVRFDHFTLKLIPHADDEPIERLYKQTHRSYNYVLGCERHLKAKCPLCGGNGEIFLDFVSDYVIRCKKCKHSTYASMNLADAIADWNNGEIQCDLSDITTE
ncbi:MAG: hypothetical protein IKU55_01445 [Clostridia bacterium]|nr:hypothetical protein [Clostridia bacterium]